MGWGSRWQRVGAGAIVALLCCGASACEVVAGIESLTLQDASVLEDASVPTDASSDAPADLPDQAVLPLPDAVSDYRGEASVDAGFEKAVDAGVDASDAGGDSGVVDATSDAAPPLYFGTDCPTGTVYTDPFDFDPVASRNWTLVAGTYVFDATKHTVTLAAGNANAQMWLGPRPAWTNYTVSVAVTLNTTNGNGGVNIRIEDVPDPAPNDSGHMYLAAMFATGVELGAETGGSGTAWTWFGNGAGTFNPTTSYVMQTSIKGQAATVSVNGIQLFTYTDTQFDLTYGSIGLHSYESTVTFGPVTVTCN